MRVQMFTETHAQNLGYEINTYIAKQLKPNESVKDIKYQYAISKFGETIYSAMLIIETEQTKG